MATTHLFTVEDGHSDGNISFLSGNGAPTGATNYQIQANVGSFYEDITSGNRYRKHTAGAGADKWDFERSVPLKLTNNITTATVVDSVKTIDYSGVTWFLSVIDATAGIKTISQLVAGHDGFSGVDAVNVGYQESFNLEFPVGSRIAGLVIDVVLNGAGATQEMALRVAATTPVSVKVRQVAI